MRQLLRLNFLASAYLVLLLSSASAAAQDTNPDAITPMNNTGDLPYSTSIGTDIEHVELSTGNLIVNIPFVSVPGRKMSFDFGLRWDARFWAYKSFPSGLVWNPEQRNWLTNTVLGWTPTQGYLTYTTGDAQCVDDSGQEPPGGLLYKCGEYGTGYLFTDNQGRKHSFHINQLRIADCESTSGCTGNFDASNYIGPSTDMDGFYASLQLPGDGVPEIRGPDGIGYYSGGTSGGVTQLQNYFVNAAGEADVRGNQQIVSPGGLDSIGRTPVTQQVSSDRISYQVVDSMGNPQTYTAHLATINVTTQFGLGVIKEYSGSRQVVDSITLPNGLSYSFGYDSWGNITQITLPTGAVVNYKWVTLPVSYSTSGTVRAVSERSVTHDGVTDTWKIDYSQTSQQTTVTVTFPPDSQGKQYQTLYTYNIYQHLAQVTYLDSPAGSRILQYDLTWDSSRPTREGFQENSLLESIKTTLENNLTSLKVFHYDLYPYALQMDCGTTLGNTNPCVIAANGSYPPPYFMPPPTWYAGSHGNVTTIREYDWGQGAPGPLVRQTIRTYLHNTTSGYFSAVVNPNTPGSSLMNVADRVQSEKIYDGTSECDGTGTWVDDGSGTITPPVPCQAQLLAETDVAYDNGSPSTYGYYGEATAVSRWNNNTGNGAVTTGYEYDVYGNVITVTDPNSHATRYSYADSWEPNSATACPSASGNAYVTSIQNALSQQSRLTYYRCTGKVASHQDSNDLAASLAGTTYKYDWQGRQTSVSYPDGGGITTTYDDIARTIDVQSLISTGHIHEAITALDQIGRKMQSRISSDPGGAVYVDTTYDALGRINTISNPYRNQVDRVSTQTLYDARSRTTSQINPDGTTRSWSYAGNTATSTDEAGNSWTNTSDALGRLIRVSEPASYVTTYSYDPLGNLKCVDQWGTASVGQSCSGTVVRSFNYDSLSRLTSSANPEAGATSYVYLDGNGSTCSGDPSLPCAKTDARGIKTTYKYDALNRLQSKSYSGPATNPASSTATACYVYDSASNGIGRLTAEWTQPTLNACSTSATTPPSNALTSRTILAYDAMGRISSETRCAFAPCTSLSPLQYMYDLAGNLTYSNNGLNGSQSPQIGWTRSYDNAGRLSSVVSTWSDPSHPDTLFKADAAVAGTLGMPAAYTPFGGLATALYGLDTTANTVALSDVRSYDTRERLTSKSVLGRTLSATISAAVTPATFGAGSAATLSANVNCNSACGQVDINVDSIDMGTQAVSSSGNVSVSTSTLPASARSVGSHTVIVSYLGNGTTVLASASTTYTVTQQQTSTTFSVSPVAFTVAEAPTFTIHVSCNSRCGAVALDVDGHGWIPSMVLDDGGNSIGPFALNYWDTSLLTVGTHTITARYLGSDAFAPSSADFTVTINPIGSQQTSISLSVDHSTFTSVEDAVASVHVGCNSACGLVLFTIDGNRWVEWNLDGNGNTQADTYWWWSSDLTLGTHTLTATYLGNSTYAPVASASQTITVSAVGTQATTVSITPPSGSTSVSIANDSYFTVHVDGTSWGFVEVFLDGNLWQQTKLNQIGETSLYVGPGDSAYFPLGTHTLQVHFMGNATYAPSDSDSLAFTVTQ